MRGEDMEKLDIWGLGRYTFALAGALLLATQPASGQTVIPECVIQVEQGGRFDNASTSDANLLATEADGQLRLGRNVFFADATSVSGALVGLGNGASIFNLNVFVLKNGKHTTIRGSQQTFQGGGIPCVVPAVQCGGQNVTLRRGDAPRTLTPGTYNLVNLENGTSLTLSPGTYNFCELKTGRNASIEVTGGTQSTINVAGDVRLENGTTFGPAAGTPTPLLNASGDVVKFAAKSNVRAFVSAPNARLSLGRGSTFTGAVCAQSLAGSRKVTVECAPDVTTTTTTTTSSTTPTSTTTSTTTPPLIQCCLPGSPMGAFTCELETASDCSSA